MMNKRNKIALLLSICLLSVFIGNAQQLDSVFTPPPPPPIKFIESVSQKAQKISSSVDAKTEKTLASYTKWEHKLLSKISKKDSTVAKQIREQAKAQLENISTALKNPIRISQYIPGLDSTATSLQYLSSITYVKEIKEKLSQSLEKVELLKSQLQKAEVLKRFLIARKNEWKTQLAKFGLAKNFKKLSKTVYYYQQQLAEYKNILNDPRKIERKALELLSKTKLWKDFFKNHSQLASLFRLPGGEDDPDYMASLAGLQTRAQVNGIIQAQLSSGGAAARDQLRQNLQAAQAQMNQLKDKILKFGSGSSDAAMPEGFKPNNQKTKTFWQRLEYGANIQSQKATNFFPVTSDLGLSVGYKLNDKSIIGIGASYKIGLGRGWNDIHFSSEGLGLRSYIDWKIKGGLWISGGYEQNLKTGFHDLSNLRTKNIWQQSGLLGLSKKLSVKTKFFKQTGIRLLWDFLSYHNTPRTQPIVVRVGYNF